jgi:pyruvate dehydrogenase (quinone)
VAHRTGTEELVDRLALAGVERVYRMMGDRLNAVPDAIRRSGKLRWVHVHHEETVAFAAGAEAQLSGRLAVCFGSSGPDNLHLIHALPDAHRSMAPVIGVAAHILKVLRDTNGMIGGAGSRGPQSRELALWYGEARHFSPAAVTAS